MSRLPPQQLSARRVATLKNGVISDGGNLWLVARHPSKVWTFRYTSPVSGKRREMGLGSAHTLSLADARRHAAEARNLLIERIDPLDKRREEERERAQKAANVMTFAMAADRFIQEHAPAWRDRKGEATWRGSLEKHIFPTFGEKSVRGVETDDVLAALRPIWLTTTETAQRLRARIERILDYAKGHGWREGENPARWKGHLAAILPKPTAIKRVKHHPAVKREDMPAVFAALCRLSETGIGAKALRFLCLTAARSGEVRGARWGEIDEANRIWTVPAERMKAGKEHRVPLTDGAMAVLEEMRPLRRQNEGDFIFPGARRGRPMSVLAMSYALHEAAGTKDVTVHGLRSTFRDWVAEETDYPSEVAEMALAHVIGNKVEAAYRRGDLFDKRRDMMKEWEKLIYIVKD